MRFRCYFGQRVPNNSRLSGNREESRSVGGILSGPDDLSHRIASSTATHASRARGGVSRRRWRGQGGVHDGGGRGSSHQRYSFLGDPNTFDSHEILRTLTLFSRERGERKRILCELSFSFFFAMARSRSSLVSSEEDAIIDAVLSFLESAADLSSCDNILHCVKMISTMISNLYEIYAMTYRRKRHYPISVI